MPESETSRFVWLVPIGALVIALFHVPYGYYQLLRVLIFCVAAYLAFASAKRSATSWAWVLGGISLVYNPIIKIALGRHIWELVNIATILVFVVHLLWTMRGHQRTNTGRTVYQVRADRTPDAMP